MVEKQDTDHCSVLGGQQMILTGQNFSSDSKVVFMEKSQGEWPLTQVPSCRIWTVWILLPLVCMMQMKQLHLCFPLPPLPLRPPSCPSHGPFVQR